MNEQSPIALKNRLPEYAVSDCASSCSWINGWLQPYPEDKLDAINGGYTREKTEGPSRTGLPRVKGLCGTVCTKVAGVVMTEG